MSNWDDGDDASLEDEAVEEETPAPMSMNMGMSMGMPGDDSAAGGSAVRNPEFDALMRAWRAEEHCPEVLPWEGEVYENFVQMIERQEQTIDDTLRSGEADSHDVLFVGPLYQMDLARVKFTLAAYVRARLRKILAQAGHIAADETSWGRLSDSEQKFVQGFLTLLIKHHRHAFLDDLPPEVWTDDAADDAIAMALSKKPQMDSFLFANVTEDLGHVQLDDDDSSFLEKGDTYVLPYARVQDFVHDKRLELI